MIVPIRLRLSKPITGSRSSRPAPKSTLSERTPEKPKRGFFAALENVMASHADLILRNMD